MHSILSLLHVSPQSLLFLWYNSFRKCVGLGHMFRTADRLLDAGRLVAWHKHQTARASLKVNGLGHSYKHSGVLVFSRPTEITMLDSFQCYHASSTQANKHFRCRSRKPKVATRRVKEHRQGCLAHLRKRRTQSLLLKGVPRTQLPSSARWRRVPTASRQNATLRQTIGSGQFHISTASKRS